MYDQSFVHSQEIQRNRKTLTVKKPVAKKAEGHEAFLKQLETSQASIEIMTMAGEVDQGVVKHSDKYTISIKKGNNSTVVYFKHGIEWFRPLQATGASGAAQ